MMNTEKREALLGYAPEHIEDHDILPYFVYCFEFSWAYPAFEKNNQDMIAYFKARFKEERKDFASLSLEQKWWLCILITMRDIARHHGSDYAAYVVQQLLNRFERINVNMLRYYCNFLQRILIQEMPEVPIIRPLELKKLGSTWSYEDIVLSFLLENKKSLLSCFKKHLRQKDFNKNYLNSVLVNDRRILRKFSTLWDAYLEVFIHFFASIYNYQLLPQQMDKLELKSAFGNLLLVFLTASISSKEKIDLVFNDVAPLLEPLVEKVAEPLKNEQSPTMPANKIM